MNHDFSDGIISSVRGYLDGREFTYNYDENGEVFYVSLTIGGEISSVRLIFDVYDEFLKILAVLPIRAKCESAREMTRMAEFLHRANYGLSIGGFEFDFNDGEIRYKVSVPVSDDDLSVDVIEDCVGRAVSTVKRYAEGILAMKYDRTVTPEEAADACDHGRSVGQPDDDDDDIRDDDDDDAIDEDADSPF